MTFNSNIKLGDEVKEKISGFRGIVTAVSFYLNGCHRVCIQPKKLKKNGGSQDSEWWDIQQVVVIKRKRTPRIRKGGGPMSAPTRDADPK